MKLWEIMGATIILLLLISWFSYTEASEPCPEFTPEQQWLLDASYHMGKPVDWGYTLAAITWQESFIADQVIRYNHRDGDYGSFGPTHVQLSTGLWLLDWEDTHERRQLLMDYMMSTDTFAMELSLMYLMMHEDRGWHGMIMKYNGRGEQAARYADSVISKVRVLERCMLWNY